VISLKETNNIEEYEQKILTKLKNSTKCKALRTSWRKLCHLLIG